MRKQLLGSLPLLLLVLIAAAETQSTSGELTKHSALQKVNVLRGEDGITVEITARGAITPQVTTLDSPARLVVDLPNTAMATSLNHIDVNRDGVKDLRIGSDGKAAPTSRVVIDLMHACKYELLPGGDNKVLVKLLGDSASTKAPQSTDAAKQDAITAKPATATSVSVAGRPVGDSNAAIQAAVIKASHIKSSPTPSVSSENASGRNTALAGANKLVFVEPTFTPKSASDTPVAVTSQPVRAINAASKFIEKPEGNLLPPTSAAMQPQATSSGAAPAFQPAVNMAAEQKAQSAQQPATVGPKYTGEPISVNLKDVDLKDFFRLIHEISGLNVVLDPNVKGTLTIVLDDVPWDQALDIVLKNNDLDRQLEGNVLRVATLETLKAEADDRRKAREAEALAVDKVTITRFLGYAHSKDVVPTVKKFLSQRGEVISDDRTNALIISDIPAVMPGLDRLLTQLDRKTQEVEIEARVVAATRSFARDIGTQLGFGWGNGHTAVGGASSAGTSPITVGGINPGYITVGGVGTAAGKGTQIPLFSNLASAAPTSGLSFVNASSNVQIDAILTMAESRGLVKILSRPRVVTQNNIQAIVKQGTRVPITTQSQLGGPPTVTYIDAFLRLTVIPQITSEKTIFLNVDVENTTPDFSHQVLNNPSLITQQATTQVLVTDGGTVVIGGVIQTNNSISIAQVPLLGNIPWLGNLFKHTTVSTSSEELIFFITPRIIET
ncbi:MAG: type and secretion system protein [Acidobacteriaceae bacterium]|nr:type and secretion system protein [Acidobacteriaceae bacterium]